MKTKKVVGYFSNWITLDQVLKASEGYTDLLFAFWVDPLRKVAGAAEAVNSEIISMLKSKGKKCVLAAGGANFKPPIDGKSFSAVDYGTELAKYAMEHKFDGIDFDIENIEMKGDTYIEWLVDATKAAASTCEESNYDMMISHAPQAPYFMASGGYAEVEKRTGGLIDYYNIQYYNQGISDYQKYEDYASIFDTEYKGMSNPTSILSISKSGVSADKLLVGKPITEKDLGSPDSTGFIPMEDLQAILEQAEANGIEFGGVMGWKVDSDPEGTWGKAMAETLHVSVGAIS